MGESQDRQYLPRSQTEASVKQRSGGKRSCSSTSKPVSNVVLPPHLTIPAGHFESILPCHVDLEKLNGLARPVTEIESAKKNGSCDADDEFMRMMRGNMSVDSGYDAGPETSVDSGYDAGPDTFSLEIDLEHHFFEDLDASWLIDLDEVNEPYDTVDLKKKGGDGSADGSIKSTDGAAICDSPLLEPVFESTETEYQSETNEADTLSPWSEESLNALDISSQVSADTSRIFLNILMDEFLKSTHAKRVVGNNHQASSQGQAGSSSMTSNQQHVSPLQSAPRSRGSRKRKPDEDDEPPPGQPQKKPRPAVTDEGSTQLLACPFCKWKPLTYRHCRTKILKEIARVKLHLWRCHQIPIHCAICSIEFSNTRERDNHLRQQNCQLRDPRNWEGITEEQKERLKRRVNTKKTKEEQWFEMYTILFPGHPLPDSPYVEGMLSDELVALQEFMAQEWPPIFDRLVEERLPEELRSQEDVVRAFSNSIFEDAVNAILLRFEASRGPSTTTPDSAYRSQSGGSSDNSTERTSEENQDPAPPNLITTTIEEPLPLLDLDFGIPPDLSSSEWQYDNHYILGDRIATGNYFDMPGNFS